MDARTSHFVQHPLFQDLGEAEVTALLSAFTPRKMHQGDVLFEAGSEPTHLHLLESGAVSVRGKAGEVFVATGPCALGELSALTGERRSLTAVVEEPAVVLEAETTGLFSVFADNPRAGAQLQTNLLGLVARKVARDSRRLAEMKENIVSTQRAMKKMRDALLESEDNPLHAALFEQMDALVEQNRKIHYLVEPSRLVPTAVDLGGQERRQVTALSNEWLYFRGPAPGLKVGAEVSMGLLLDKKEIPVSGRVERADDGECVVFLDELIPPYEAELTAHLTRAQLLDVVL